MGRKLKQTKQARQRRADDRERREAKQARAQIERMAAARRALHEAQNEFDQALAALDWLPARSVAELAGISKSEAHRRLHPSHTGTELPGQLQLPR